MKLNLTTNCTEHTVLKEYLEENASASLAEKINHGVFIEKDGKRLLNRKDLNGFMIYACNEAKKLADKGATSACIKSDIVYGWAIHYFEEDDIVGKLYNEDGSEYTPPKPEYKPIQRVPAPTVAAKPTPPKSQQFNLFDFVSNAKTEEKGEEKDVKNEFDNMQTIGFIRPADEPKTLVLEQISDEESEDENDDVCTLNVDEETGEIIPTQPIQESTSPLYRQYMKIQEQYPDYVIAYRIGDYYEVFGDFAIKVANDLDFTLTGRDCGLANRIPMIGFPYYSSQAYFDKICKRNLLVVVDGEDIQIYPNQQEIITDSVEDDDFAEELERQQYFDKDVLCILYEIFDGNLDVQ